jgi:argininosuccinate lyase
MKKKPWGGRFARETKGEVEDFTASTGFDVRLAKYDIMGSIAHVKTLSRSGVIDPGEGEKIVRELEHMGKEIEEGTFIFDPALEDVHMNIESKLTERLGEAGGRLHTARSRNDQVATDTRLFVKDEAAKVIGLLGELRAVILDRSREHLDIVMPGYTHLQRAQPILFSHYLLAYWEMFYRDAGRFRMVYDTADVLPLGSGALAGVSYPLDREYTAKLLGFGKISRNSIDAVSDRDYIIEYLSAAAIAMMHLSRLAEEIIIFSTAEFGFYNLPDEYATGSSIMPQKKNPDVPELVRGKTGRVYGDLVSLLTAMKGLPLAYMRDLQEDKEALFDAIDTLSASLPVMRGLLSSIHVNGDRMGQAARGYFITATDAADYLVKKGMNFREAHGLIGRIVSELEAEGKDITDLTAPQWRHYSPLFEDDIVDAVSVDSSISSKSLFGGTARGAVEKMLSRLERLEEEEKTVGIKPVK